METLWRIEMLGGLRLARGEAVITRFRTRQTAGLLAYLAYTPQRAHPREALSEQFWPEDDFDAARHKLNVAVSALRQQLEPPGIDYGAVLLSDRASVRLNPAAVSTDVAEFEALLATPPEPVEAEERYARAVELYHGPLLPGFDDPWVFAERERLASLHVQALRQLAKQLAAADRLESALDVARRAVNADPLREDSHAELMRLLITAGQPAAALQQFRRLERLLADELGSAPAAATRAILGDIEPARPAGRAYQRPGDRRSVAARPPSEAAELNSSPPAPAALAPDLEPVGGAVPLGSPYYVVRPADADFEQALARGDSIVLVKGARQVGKTSLLARGLEEARQAGARVAFTDFQGLNTAHLESADTCLRALAESLAEELDLEISPAEEWDARRGPSPNFRRYLRRFVLGSVDARLVWGLDEVDRLFTCPYGSEVFGLFRALHNERALNPRGPWSRLTLAIAYATEAHLFITDLNQSPFNVGTRLELADFTWEQVADLHRRHGSPLRHPEELARLYRLVGGHPYLVRRALHELAAGHAALGDVEEQADQEGGIFGDHLRRLALLLGQHAGLAEAMRSVLAGQPLADREAFFRLRSAGVLTGETPADARPRCPLYERTLRRHFAPA